jgi:hypothetical protein
MHAYIFSKLIPVGEYIVPVGGLGIVMKKWTRLSVIVNRPMKKSPTLRRRNSLSKEWPCGYHVKPRSTGRGMVLTGDSPRYFATTE